MRVNGQYGEIIRELLFIDVEGHYLLISLVAKAPDINLPISFLENE
jgi:hypothetical protein